MKKLIKSLYSLLALVLFAGVGIAIGLYFTPVAGTGEAQDFMVSTNRTHDPLGIAVAAIASSEKSVVISTRMLDQSISGIPKPMEYSDEHSSVFVMPKISKDNARSAKILARTLGLTVSATEQRIRETKKAIQEFCMEDEVFQEAWGRF